MDVTSFVKKVCFALSLPSILLMSLFIADSGRATQSNRASQNILQALDEAWETMKTVPVGNWEDMETLHDHLVAIDYEDFRTELGFLMLCVRRTPYIKILFASNQNSSKPKKYLECNCGLTKQIGEDMRKRQN